MQQLINQHFTLFIALVLLVSRAGDIFTTFLVSPTLKLERNLLARRLGWKYLFATLLCAFIPYFSIRAGIVFATASLLVSATNASGILIVRAVGEQEYFRLLETVVAGTRTRTVLAYRLLPAMFFGLLGFFMLLCLPDSIEDRSRFFATGMLAYSFAVSVWSIVGVLKQKRKPF